jgi:hypothetical protein
MSQTGCQRSSVQYPRKGGHHKNQKAIPYQTNAFLVYGTTKKENEWLAKAAHTSMDTVMDFSFVWHMNAGCWRCGSWLVDFANWSEPIGLKLSGDERRPQSGIDKSCLEGSSEKYEFGAEVNSHMRQYKVKSNICKNLRIPSAVIK